MSGEIVVEVQSKAHRIGHATSNLEGSSIPLSAVLKIGSSELTADASLDESCITHDMIMDHEGKLARRNLSS
jgi:hypothetical protein